MPDDPVVLPFCDAWTNMIPAPRDWQLRMARCSAERDRAMEAVQHFGSLNDRLRAERDAAAKQAGDFAEGVTKAIGMEWIEHPSRFGPNYPNSGSSCPDDKKIIAQCASMAAELIRVRAQNVRLVNRLSTAGLLGEPLDALNGDEQMESRTTQGA